MNTQGGGDFYSVKVSIRIRFFKAGISSVRVREDEGVIVSLKLETLKSDGNNNLGNH